MCVPGGDTETLSKGTSYVLGETEKASRRFHAVQNSEQYKTYELLDSGIFHNIFRPWVTENRERETAGEKGLCTEDRSKDVRVQGVFSIYYLCF